MKIITIMLVGLLPILVFATTFRPVSLETQLKDSNMALHGNYIGKSYKKLSSGQIVTIAKFKIIKIAGIEQSELINKNEFSVIYPGGEWEGIVHHIYGAPKFKENEEVFLVLNRLKNGFWLHNLSLGKYRIEKKGRIKTLVSSVFPNHPYFGRIDFKKAEGIVGRTLGGDLKIVQSDKMIIKTYKNRIRVLKTDSSGRKIASYEEDTAIQQDEPVQLSIFWIIMILACIGGATLFVRKSRRNL